jgi:hypothetical protein
VTSEKILWSIGKRRASHPPRIPIWLRWGTIGGLFRNHLRSSLTGNPSSNSENYLSIPFFILLNFFRRFLINRAAGLNSPFCIKR